MTVEISALICTRNRAEYLRKALASLVAQTLPPACYEIIVIDNASEDHTRAVVEQFSHVPNLRYIHEPLAGLSRARNTGWQNARGQYVAFLDDDAIASSHWLEKYLEMFQTIHPVPGSVGGRAIPLWEVPKPAWLSNRMLSTLSIYHWSDIPTVLTSRQQVTGCNIAYPVKVLAEVGGFPESLGRISHRLLSGEETYMRHQLDARGYITWYHPEIYVQHHISANRLTKSWFRRHAYGTGQTTVIMRQLERPLLLRQRFWLGAKRLVWMLIRAPLMVLSLNPAARFRRQCQVIESIGFIVALSRPGEIDGQST